MANVNDFFSHKNTVKKITDTARIQLTDYLEVIKAFARTTYKSIYVIDYQEKGFEYVSDNPLFLCGYTAEEIKDMGYQFYFNCVTPKDLDLLVKINTIGFDFYDKIPLPERKEYTISYDFHLKTPSGKPILINQKLTPLFLTEKGKIWKAMCLVSLSNEKESGNIQITRKGYQQVFIYDLKGSFWKVNEKRMLTEQEIEVLQLSARGFTIQQISETICLSTDTVKYHRKKLYEKLGVTNISEAIVYATNNRLI
ncbi:response regulator transcription factor [Mesonia sp. HuA40]|uniref:response regulator transcription factor n=1 Tax=Mesonia sp. HuA40 TaxID=2602761 RepID=UPI0011C9C6FD|nr:helix-turn-helix transcriptional regulator [Mesonia sp. HuA40]TXK75105.1 helix-turn-helix transcriptional regulator [Mesonia sp. HuA40]